MATTTTSANFPQWYSNQLGGLANLGQQIGTKSFAPYTGTRYAGFTPEQQAGMNMITRRATAGSPVTSAMQDQVTGTLRGDYLNNNPYLEQQLDATRRNVMGAFNTMERRGGSFGNATLGQYAGRQMADAENSARLQNYGDERQRQMQAMLFAPQAAAADYTDAQQLFNVGQQRQGLNQNIADYNYNEFLRSQEWPFKTLSAYGGALGMSNPGTTQTTTTPDPSKAQSVLGGGLLGYGLGNAIGGQTFGIDNSLLGAGVGGLLGLF